MQNAEDVLEAIRPLRLGPLREPREDYEAPQAGADAEEADRTKIAELLGPTPVAVDEIIRQSSLKAAIVHTVLLELELAGRVERHAGGKVSAS